MNLVFDQFQFDCNQLVLTKGQEVIPLTDKASQLLALFISHPNKIHTKAEILETLWPDRVVSEQVIFQNIYLLRTMLGSDAIKTFSKKGYQWQRPLEQVEGTLITSVAKKQNEKCIKPQDLTLELTSGRFIVAIGMLVIVILFALLNPLLFDKQVVPLNELSFINQETGLSEVSYHNFGDTEIRSLFDSPNSTWKRLKKTEATLLVANKTYNLSDGVALRFHIQGRERGWHDYIWTKNTDIAQSELSNLIQIISATQFFSTESDHKAMSLLEVLPANSIPEEILVRQKSQLAFHLHDYDKATAILAEQINSPTSDIDFVLASLMQIKTLMWNQHWQLAKSMSQRSLDMSNKLGLPHLEAEVLMQSSWISLIGKQFEHGIQTLNKAAVKARIDKEYLKEFNAHLIQSLIATKVSKPELAATQLGMAKELSDLHQLSAEHQIPLLRASAWIAQTVDARIDYQRMILEIPYTPAYQHDFYYAAMQVLENALMNKEWGEAINTLRTWQVDSYQQLINAKISSAQGKIEQAEESSYRAFQQALREHEKLIALDSALFTLLIALESGAQSQIEPAIIEELVQYIKYNETRRWNSQNNSKLKQLSQLTPLY